MTKKKIKGHFARVMMDGFVTDSINIGSHQYFSFSDLQAITLESLFQYSTQITSYLGHNQSNIKVSLLSLLLHTEGECLDEYKGIYLPGTGTHVASYMEIL